MPELHVLRVFVEEDEAGGNPLGVFLDGPGGAGRRASTGSARPRLPRDRIRGRRRPRGREDPHAGGGDPARGALPLVGTAWLMEHRGAAVDTLRPPAGEVPTWTEGGLTWIRARPDSAPRFELRELPSAAEVDSHPGAGAPSCWTSGPGRTSAPDASAPGVFAPALGVEDDEATGSGDPPDGRARPPPTIHQGRGSQIVTSPGPGGTVDRGRPSRPGRDAPLPTGVSVARARTAAITRVPQGAGTELDFHHNCWGESRARWRNRGPLGPKPAPGAKQQQ